MHDTPAFQIHLRPNNPDFLDLPWHLPVEAWAGQCDRIEEVPRGLSRHPVVFINYDGILYAVKEMPRDNARLEYELLVKIEDQHLPAVGATGYVITHGRRGSGSALITRFLDHSIPYRSLFLGSSLIRYREHLLDGIAGLLVQLHLAGVFWGDCSLSNTLFRRDAGALRAYLVDAETAEIHTGPLSPALRHHDMEIMEENLTGELADIETLGTFPDSILFAEISPYIRLQYQKLWEEITHEETIHPNEHYRIHERIRSLNALGFSVGEVKLIGSDDGEQLRLTVVVSDRNFHRDRLFQLTGVEAEELQARLIMNEIIEIKATLSQMNNRSTPLSAAAYYWLENIYKPTIFLLQTLIDCLGEAVELYCQVLEHKWYLSEQAQHDVGHHTAATDFLRRFGNPAT